MTRSAEASARCETGVACAAGRRVAALLAAVVAAGLGAPAVLAASAPDLGRAFEPVPVSKPIYGIKSPSEDPERQRTFIKAADGVDLFVETWLPKAKDGNVPPPRVPTIFTITPYRTQGVTDSFMRDTVVPRGYAWSQLNVRGTGESGGCIQDHDSTEVEDGLRALDYLATRAPWSNGVVGGKGLSYEGGSMFSVAASGDPRARALKAILIGAPVASRYDTKFLDGVPQLIEGPASEPAWMALSAPGETTTPERLAERPACWSPRVRESLLEDPTGDFTPYYAEREHRDGSEDIRAATLMWHGLQDLDLQPIMQAGMFERITAPKHGQFGVYGHELPSDHNVTRLRREWERGDWAQMVVAWFDQYVKGLPAGAERWPVVEVQGTDGQWRAEPEWPFTGGPAGQLAIGPGGQLGARNPTGSTDYTELELESSRVERSGVSAAGFSTAPLPERLELTGPVVLDAWVTLDRPDAHLAAAIEALDADGNAIPGGRDYGARSARHLEPLVENRFAQAEGKDPPVGKPIRVAIRLQPADIVVPKGGRLRLVLAGSVRTGVGLNELLAYLPGGFGSGVDFDPAGVAQPSQPSGTATHVTVHHDCEHQTALRFLTPRRNADLLNVREKDEPAETPLADNRGHKPPVSDGGGVASASVCGRAPLRHELLGPVIRSPAAMGPVVRGRLVVRPRHTRVGKRTRFRFRVTTLRAGKRRRLDGAVIRFAGGRVRTNAEGRAAMTVRFRRAGRRRAVVSKPGFRSASVRVRILRRSRERRFPPCSASAGPRAAC